MPYDLLRLALFARANVREALSRFKWWSLGWTAGVFPRRTAVQTKLFYELTRTADRAYRARPFDLDIVAIRGEEFGGWDWRLRRTEPDLSWHRITERARRRRARFRRPSLDDRGRGSAGLGRSARSSRAVVCRLPGLQRHRHRPPRAVARIEAATEGAIRVRRRRNRAALSLSWDSRSPRNRP